MKTPFFISHHGIKGQKWGVMNGPPYPLDKETSVRIKKGTVYSHVSQTKKLKPDDRGIYLFNPNDPRDAEVYRGAYSTLLRYFNKNNVYEHTFETTQDLILPSQKTKVDAFIEMYKKEKVSENSDFPNFIDSLVDIANHPRNKNGELVTDNADFLSEVLLGKNKENSSDIQKYKAFMTVFNVDTRYKKQSEKFINSLKNKGFNAIIDDNNVDTYNGAHNPIYVFKGKDFIKKIGRRKVSWKETNKYAKQIKERQNGTMIL